MTKFHEEHQRLLQALLESRARESVFLQQLRGLKESLVSASLRLHVSTRVAEEDGASMDRLSSLLLEAKTQSVEAEKRATVAIDIVSDLNNEINTLKKAFKDSNIGIKEVVPIQLNGVCTGNTALLTDDEVDAMMGKFFLEPKTTDLATQELGPFIMDRTGDLGPDIGGRRSSHDHGGYLGVSIDKGEDHPRPSTSSGRSNNMGDDRPRPSTSSGRSNNMGGDCPRPSTSSGRSSSALFDIQQSRNQKTSSGLASSRVSTPFQQWKTDKCKWSPDTPAASTNYDKYTADVTAEMTEQSNHRELDQSLKHFSTLQKPVKSYMGKINSKVFENLNILPDLKGDEQKHMTFDIDHKHFLSTNEKLPTNPTFRSKQQARPESSKANLPSGKGGTTPGKGGTNPGKWGPPGKGGRPFSSKPEGDSDPIQRW
eukprot:CAMPEP_0119039742 /NCGR_PEP_ID=MMETSP1177-20130426/9371_1 /TAXON_ID=2985 /ORGANISM="Ochromonas sp, Strain CCMP1899" /LENGTH=425 /DNA_ID=CAMNT_0007003981 /DNA_START=300 /DNA_END=1574 /DNA_ORIENTATION=+